VLLSHNVSTTMSVMRDTPLIITSTCKLLVPTEANGEQQIFIVSQSQLHNSQRTYLSIAGDLEVRLRHWSLLDVAMQVTVRPGGEKHNA